MDFVFALSVQNQIEKYGAYAGLAAIVGLAVLALLYFAQAREVKRLVEWAGRAPERAQELEERVAQQAELALQAQTGRVVAQPRPAVTPTPAATPAQAPTPAPATSAAVSKPGTPTPAPTPTPTPGVPAPAVALATGAGPATAVAPAASASAPTAIPTPGTPAPPGTPPPGAPRPAATPNGVAGERIVPPAPVGPQATVAVPRVTPAPSSKPVPAPTPAPTRTAPAIPLLEPEIPRREPSRRRGLGSVLPVIGAAAILAAAAVFAASQFIGGDGGSAPAPASKRGATAKPPAQVNPSRRGEVTVSVLNGTTVPGLAASIRDRLVGAGFGQGLTTNNTDNTRTTTVVSFSPGYQRWAAEVRKLLGIGTVQPISETTRQIVSVSPDTPLNIVVIVGADATP